MTNYRMSNGEKISKAEIDRKIKQAKENIIHRQKDWYGYNFCQECQRNGFPKNADQMKLLILDVSHIISVDKCQKTGRSELAFDPENMEILCRHHHEIRDKLNLRFDKK